MKLIYENSPEAGARIAAKALERVRIQAQNHTRNFLCLDCYDQRCRNDSICPAFICVTEDVTWELVAKAAETN